MTKIQTRKTSWDYLIEEVEEMTPVNFSLEQFSNDKNEIDELIIKNLGVIIENMKMEGIFSK